MSFLQRIAPVGGLLATLVIAGTAQDVSFPDRKDFPGVPRVAPDGGCGLPAGTVVRRRAQAACPGVTVTPPPGWFSGDSHEHVQLCFDPSIKTEEQVRDELLARGENVASMLLWGVRVSQGQFLQGFSPLITGSEDPSGAGYPTLALQYGIETSGFQCARLGHTIALGIDAARSNFFLFGGCPGNDASGDYAAPVVDFFQTDPDAVIGYAHQSWPVPLFAPAAVGFSWQSAAVPSWVGADARCLGGKILAFPDPTTTNIHPTLAVHDLATGRLDFLEAVDLHLDLSLNTVFEDRWYGLYYKLLNAGQRVAITGGTDADCVGTRINACEPRTWVKLPPGTAFSYDAWIQGIKQGRTSVADGAHQFLEVSVAGLDPGDRLYANTTAGQPPQVPVTVRYHLASGATVTDSIEIVQDGDVVRTLPMGQRRGGVFEATVQLPFVQSGWVAARTASGGTHTGAVFVYVDRKPILHCEEAEYFTLYSDYLVWLFDWAASLSDPSILKAWVGCSEAEIRSHIAAGRRVFAAVRDHAAGPPTNVSRLGFSTPSGRGPMAIGIDDEPRAGSTPTLDCFPAPPSAVGALLVSPFYDDVDPDVLLGARLFVLGLEEGIPYVAFPARASKAGFAQMPVALPPALAGFDLYAQWLWWNPPGYNAASLFSSSDALELRVR